MKSRGTVCPRWPIKLQMSWTFSFSSFDPPNFPCGYWLRTPEAPLGTPSWFPHPCTSSWNLPFHLFSESSAVSFPSCTFVALEGAPRKKSRVGGSQVSAHHLWGLPKSFNSVFTYVRWGWIWLTSQDGCPDKWSSGRLITYAWFTLIFLQLLPLWMTPKLGHWRESAH